MSQELLEKSVNELMEKFGAGNHKPGSGSAAAFQGMVSAKLISTVISLTAEEKRKHLYSKYIDELLVFHDRIESHIYPKLEELFKLDSIQFDKTIKQRMARDSEKDEIKKNQLRRQALEELKVSITIPLNIADICKELAEIAAYVFDYGFKSARGDSQVALSGAVSSIAGCIAIIRLNILSFNSDEYGYTAKIIENVNDLNKEYQNLNKIANSKIDVLREEFDKKVPLFEGINKIINNCRADNGRNIENHVRELQNLIWYNKHLIWKKEIPNTILAILQPEFIFKQALGYDYISSSNYAVMLNENESIAVAGIIDQPNKIVAISNDYSNDIQNFTAAHELGHCFLHNQPILHRDLPITHVGQNTAREKVEIEADKFATYFLMPTKWVKIEFESRYSKGIFEINENSAFKFGGRRIGEIKQECKNIRGLSRKLASSTSFDGNYFISLSELFKVSVEAMAIRLEELNLLKY